MFRCICVVAFTASSFLLEVEADRRPRDARAGEAEDDARPITSYLLPL